MARRTESKQRLLAYAHLDKRRVNNPPVGLVTPDTDADTRTQTYCHDQHLDPSLSWAGKSEHTSFEVPTVSLHVRERIDPRTIIEGISKQSGEPSSASLFLDPAENPPIRRAIEFYKHLHNWTNRLIAGDSLLVMNSLIEKEALSGKVQAVYVDPPYGIRYGSNFQPFVNDNQVIDGKDSDLTSEPEQIRAFRDTWELGIHSYLTYLRDRLFLIRDLLSMSGSCFLQIGKDNIHRVGIVMDELFGANNRVATISFATKSSSSATRLPEVADYLLWYCKDINQLKYRQLYEHLNRSEIIEYFSSYVMVELPDGTCRKPTPDERFSPDKYLPEGARIYKRISLDSQGKSTSGRSDPFQWDGHMFACSPNRHWSISKSGMDRLGQLGRLDYSDKNPKSLSWKKYEDEVSGRKITNVWPIQMYENNKQYVVQTALKTVQRCLLMATDPGDLVFDPTCGSGTTAYMAEHWGRRWITCDTSRVAIAIARQRLMTATYKFYELAHPHDGVGSGFNYHTVDSVSPQSLGYDSPPRRTVLYDKPRIDKATTRVTGPFTVEAVPAPTIKSISAMEERSDLSQTADSSVVRKGATQRQTDWRDALLRSGIRGKSGQRISFERLEPLPGTEWLHADGQTRIDDLDSKSIPNIKNPGGSMRIVVSFGPDHAPLEQKQVTRAIEESQRLVPAPKIIVFAAFHFDSEAAKDIDETNWPGVTLLKAQMNADLLTADLKKGGGVIATDFGLSANRM